MAPVAGLCGFAFARPVLGAYGNAPESLLEYGVTGLGVARFAMLWMVLPALIVWAALVALRLAVPRCRAATAAGVFGLLAASALAPDLIQNTAWNPGVIALIAVVFGGAFGYGYHRWDVARQFVSLLVISPLVFGGLFVLASPAADLIRDPDVPAPAATVDVPIVVIVYDELPTASLLDSENGINADAFPGFAKLATQSTWYRNHTTVAPTTGRAAPAIVTGRLPPIENVAPVASQHSESLFTMLGSEYDFHVSEPLTAVCPSRLCIGAEEARFDSLVSRSARVWKDRFARAAPDEETFFDVPFEADSRGADLESFSRDIGVGDGPRLDYLHTVLPHVPWRLLPSGARYDAGLKDNGVAPFSYEWIDDEGARYARMRHALQLQYADRQLSELIGRMEASGAWDRSLVVVTADHGIALTGPYFARLVDRESLAEIAYAPLFVKAPGQTAGKVDDRDSRSIDVLPTIAATLGVEIPWDVDGVSHLDPPIADRGPKLLTPVAQDEITKNDDGYVELGVDDGFETLLGFPPISGGDGPLAVHRTGEWGALVGQRALDIPAGPPVSFGAELDRVDARYDLEAGLIPVVYRATVTEGEGQPVALIVNGVVAGWSTAGVEGRVRFIASESLLEEGENDVSLAALGGTPAEPTLRPIP